MKFQIIGKLNYGFRCYLSVLGGFKTESVLNSKSMYQSITKQFKIHTNGVLDIISDSSNGFIKKHASIKWDDTFFKTKMINVNSSEIGRKNKCFLPCSMR